MKMVIVVYNEALDNEMMEILENCMLKNYTKITGVFGRGESSGTHLGTDIWPGRNSLLYIACEDKDGRKVIASVKELRKSLGPEGVKAFLLPLDEIT